MMVVQGQREENGERKDREREQEQEEPGEKVDRY